MTTPPSSDPAAATSSDAGLPALERLRQRVEAAAAEIERLRAANASLAERVQALADEVADGDDLPSLTLEGDPDELRTKVERFIDAIDQMLADPATRVTDAPSEAVEADRTEADGAAPTESAS